MLFKGLYSCLHIWRRNHLPQSLLTVLVKYFLSVLQRFLKLSQTFNTDTLALHFLFTVWGQLSTMNAFSQYWKSRPSEDNLAFTFSMAVISAYICVPSPSHTDCGFFFWHIPTSHPKIFMTQITVMVWSFTKARHPGMWSFRSITMNKTSGSDEIPVELFQILKDDAVKVLHSICQQIQKTQQWPQDWKRSVFIPVPKKGNAKIMFKLLNDCIHLTH